MTRQILLSLAILISSYSASATDLEGKGAKTPKKSATTEVAPPRRPRREAAAFVDPTIELAVFVERVRIQRQAGPVIR